MICETQTLEKDDIVFILIHLCSLDADLRPLTVKRWNNSNNFQPMTFVTKSSILNVAGVLDPPLAKTRRVEQNTHMVNNQI